jgi:hypothetical protein
VLQEGKETRVERKVMVLGKEEVARAGHQLDGIPYCSRFACRLLLVGSIQYCTMTIKIDLDSEASIGFMVDIKASCFNQAQQLSTIFVLIMDKD